MQAKVLSLQINQPRKQVEMQIVFFVGVNAKYEVFVLSHIFRCSGSLIPIAKKRIGILE